MARKAKELSALVVGRLNTPGNHAVGGVSGLYLYVNDNGARSWVLRISVSGKRRHMGLGGFPDVTLAQARDKARTLRAAVDEGIDPIAQREMKRSALRAASSTERTFEQVASAYIQAHCDSWKNPKHRAQWVSTIETYANPIMGKLLVAHVHQEHVLQVLEPIWKSKNETASRLRGRIEAVLDFATVRKYRTGENPARWKGYLDKLLPAPGKVQKVNHHRALTFDQMPAFMAALRQQSGGAARALEFAILCAARSGEVRGATWAEIDLRSGTWIVPAERMKAGKEHRVPLSPQALALLGQLPRIERCDWVFPAPRGGQFSDKALTAVMRRMAANAVPHGFRSTFRDWIGEHTNYPRDLAEMALAHTLESKVEAAYRRGDALERRRQLMNDWANAIGHVSQSEIARDPNGPSG